MFQALVTNELPAIQTLNDSVVMTQRMNPLGKVYVLEQGTLVGSIGNAAIEYILQKSPND